MPTRRLLLFIAITCLLSAVLFTISGANAGSLSPLPPNTEDGSVEVGEWLQIIKEPDSPYVNRGDAAEFTILIINTSTQFDMVNIVVSDELAPQCDNTFPEIEAGDEQPYTCRQENVQNAFTNEVVVTGRNATNNRRDEASATADIEVLELLATIEPEATTVPAPGGDLEFSITLTNRSSVPVIIESLVSKQFGNLADPQNEKLDPNTCTNAIGRQLSAKNGNYTCKFTTDISNSPGEYLFEVEAMASVKDDPAYTVSGNDETTVEIIEIIATSLTTKKQSYATGSLINLTVSIKNLSPSSSVNILALEDADLGDITLLEPGNCELPQTLQPGENYKCNYPQTVTVEAGTNQEYLLNVSGETTEKPIIPISDDATVSVTAVQPITYLPVITRPRWNTCVTALWVKTNTQYNFNPSDDDAYYKFELERTADIIVNIDNFTPRRGQINLFSYIGQDCNSSINFIDEDRSVNNKNRELVGENQPPGTYYIRVASGEEFSSTDSYTLIINTK